MGKLLDFPIAEFGARFSERVLQRLWEAKNHERNPHISDDVFVAWLTVMFASRGSSTPFTEATYQVFGVHPDLVFQKMTAWRRWKLGLEYSLWFDEAGNLRPNRLDIPDYDPTTGFLLQPRVQVAPDNGGKKPLFPKAPLRLVVYRTEIRDDGKVLYHGEQLECGHFHTEFLDANPGRQRRRCLACKHGVAVVSRPTIVQEAEPESLNEEAAKLRILFA